MFILYPNPNNGVFNIELPVLTQVLIMNSLGEIFMNSTLEKGNHFIDIQNEATGIYFVEVINKNKQHVIKIVKQ